MFIFRNITLLLALCMTHMQDQHYFKPINRHYNKSNSSGVVSFFKKGVIGSFAIGAALGLHVATELPIILAHEYGHSFGNVISGGGRGWVSVECMLGKHLLAVLMPFFGVWHGPPAVPNELITLLAGPLSGMSANYLIMAMVHGGYDAITAEQLDKHSIYNSITQPAYGYKRVSDCVSQLIAYDRYKSEWRLFGEICIATFTMLKLSKLFGEFLYALTPFSINGGDGTRIWHSLGVTADYTVTPAVGLSLAAVPAVAALSYGIVKGVYNRYSREDQDANEVSYAYE